MELHVKADAKTLLIGHTQAAPATIEVWWSHEGDCYPGEGWTDFAAPLAWWLRGICEMLTTGAPCELDFMDGPYSMSVRRDADSAVVRLRGRTACWRVLLAELATEALRAGEQVLWMLVADGATGNDVRALGTSVGQLRRALPSVRNASQGDETG